MAEIGDGAWAQGLAEGKFDRVAVGIGHAAIIADREILLARLPDQPALAACLGRDRVDLRPALAGEAEMAVIVGPALDSRSLADEDEDQAGFAPGLGQPHDLAVMLGVGPFVHGTQAAEFLVEFGGRCDVAHMQRDMGEGRAHV